jgi:hypothetical protein
VNLDGYEEVARLHLTGVDLDAAHLDIGITDDGRRRDVLK